MSTVPWHAEDCSCPRCAPADLLRLDQDSGEVIDGEIVRAPRLQLRLDPARRAATASGKVKAHLSLEPPRWDTGDRVTVQRSTRPGYDEFGVRCEVTDAPLHLRIADVQGPFAVGKLVDAALAGRLGFRTLPDFVRDWSGEAERQGGTALQKRMVDEGRVNKFTADETQVWITMWQTEEVERPRFLARTPQDSTDEMGHGYTTASANNRAMLDAGEAPPESWSQDQATEAYRRDAPARVERIEDAERRKAENRATQRAERDERMKALAVRVPRSRAA